MRIETAVIEVVNNCNLKCLHCYGFFNSCKVISQEDFRDYIKKLYSIGVTHLIISGGEPLLLGNGILTYLKIAREEKMHYITIVTNGTIQNVDYYRIMQLVDSIQISIDGNKEVHDLIRGKGNYERTLKTIIHLANLNSSKVIIMMALHSDNYPKLQYVYDLARRYHTRFAVEIVTACGRGANIRLLTIEQLRELREFLISNSISCNDPISFCLTTPKNFFNRFMIAGCAAGVSAICIDTDGTIYPCARLRLPMGNIKDGYDAMYSSLVFKQLNNRELFKGKCSFCSNLFICGGCRARSFAKNQDYLDEDPYCITFEQKTK